MNAWKSKNNKLKSKKTVKEKLSVRRVAMQLAVVRQGKNTFKKTNNKKNVLLAKFKKKIIYIKNKKIGNEEEMQVEKYIMVNYWINKYAYYLRRQTV